MLGLAWFYVAVGIQSPLFAAAFAGCQAAVMAIIVRGVQRLAQRSLGDVFLWAIAGSALVATLAGAHFAIPLASGGLAYLVHRRGRRTIAAAILVGMLITVVGLAVASGRLVADRSESPTVPSALETTRDATPAELLFSGVKAGALTFGGAYTAIPFVQDDAVRQNEWLTNSQFLDGLALSGILPAPLIIFATFVGYVGGGAMGAIAITVGIFLPAFVITLLGHRYLEAAVDNRRLHAVLDGVTAGVIGLVAATAIPLGAAALTTIAALAIFGVALAALYLWRAGVAMAVVVVAAGAAGAILFAP
jgi:chromate transporter